MLASACEFNENVCRRCVLGAVARHSKVLCMGARGACAGLALALLALSDVALADERASFALGPALAGAAALSQRCPPLPQALVCLYRIH